MRVLTEDQRSDAWHAARRGRITASSIDKVLAGKKTKGRTEYMKTLVLDLEGIDDFRDNAPYFELGRKFEPYALGWYQDVMHCDIRTTGFVLHESYNWMGASPDGLVDPKGGVEAKFRRSLRTFHDSCIKPIPRVYQYQMQACMWVCDREWWDYLNYWRSVDGRKEQGHVRRVHRDDAQIKEIEDAAIAFWRDTVREYIRTTGEDHIVFPWATYQQEQSNESASHDISR